MSSIDPATLLALVGGTGAGAVVDRAAQRIFGRRREAVDVAQVSVETLATVLAEVRIELQSTRSELAETRLSLARAHTEIGELRAELAGAHAEIAALRNERSTK
jgi:chromosome segregation ATPase